MKKAECIELYGEEEWERKLEQTRAWRKAHPDKPKEQVRKWRENNPDRLQAQRRKTHREENRKGGKNYENHLVYNRTGLRGERNKIRFKHAYQYRLFKKIIAPDSQIHHEWIPKTAKYRGVALVEANPHQYGIIDVIQILDGKITLLTEEDIKKG